MENELKNKKSLQTVLDSMLTRAADGIRATFTVLIIQYICSNINEESR